MSNQPFSNRQKKSVLIIISFIALLFLPTIYTAYPSESDSSRDSAKLHRDRGVEYIQNGNTKEAVEEFDKAIKSSHNEGYIKGKEEGSENQSAKIYVKYVVLSIVAGLYFAAIFVAILWWSDISTQTKSIRRKFRIKEIVKGIKVKLSPELSERAIAIARSKEKLRDAIKQEDDLELNGLASNVLPRLDELVKQAMLLLERQQILTDYMKDIDIKKLEDEIWECEQKLKKEDDQEANDALTYQMTQTKNKQENYHKARAKIRTSEAILKGIAARIDATSLDLMSLPSVLMKKQEFLERISVELDEEIIITKKATESLVEEEI